MNSVYAFSQLRLSHIHFASHKYTFHGITIVIHQILPRLNDTALIVLLIYTVSAFLLGFKQAKLY